MGTKKADHTETCEVCGKEVELVGFINVCPETQRKGAHWRCKECGHISKNRIITKI